MYIFKPTGNTHLIRMGECKRLTLLCSLVCAASAASAVPISYEAAREKALEHAGIAGLVEDTDAEARARRSAAAAIPNPSAFLEYETLDGAVGESNETTAGISTRVDFLWKRGARIESADRRNRIAEHRIDDEQRRISYDVARFFLTYESASDELATLRSSRESLMRARQIAESLVANGEISQSHLRRIELAIEQLEMEFVDLEARQAGIAAQLAALTGVGGAAPNGRIQLVDLAFNSAAEAIAAAHEHRPDLQAIEAYAQWQEAETNRVRAEGRPEASLDLAYKRNSDDQSGAFIGLSVELPIFGQSRAQTALALAEQRHADRQFNQARRGATGEVAAAFQRWQRLLQMERQQSASRSDKGSDNAYLQSVAAAFTAGDTSLLEYLDALSIHRDSTRSRVTFMHQLKLATVELALLTGRDVPITTAQNLSE